MKKQIEKIKDYLARKKVDGFEIYLERSWGVTTTVQEKKLESVEHDDSLGFGLRVSKNKGIGFSYGTDFSAQAIQYVVDQALASSEQTSPEPDFTWNKPGALYPPISQWDESISSLPLKDKIDMAFQLEKGALDLDERIKKVHSASYSETLEEIHIVNSAGLNLHRMQSNFDVSLMAVAEQGSDSETGYDVMCSPFWKNLSPRVVGQKAAVEAIHLLGGKRISNYRGPIILHPYVLVEMLEILGNSFLAEEIQKSNSYFKGKLGKKVYSSAITVIDDGTFPQGVMTRPFDAEGTPQQKTVLIDQGVVSHFLYDTYWARREGVKSTGNAEREGPLEEPKLDSTNFYIKQGALSFDDLLGKMGEGILITDVIGMHMADSVSGDFSVGIQGNLIRNGKRDHALRSVALSGNMHDLFSDVTDVGSDLKFYGPIGSPSLLVSEASISGE